jgi:hypothetical protein
LLSVSKILLAFAFSGFLLALSGCNNIQELFSDNMDEGIVEYDIEYLQDERQNPLISLLPTTMQYRFKDNVSVQKIEGWMSIFAMAGIADRKNNKSLAMLKIMNEKYVYETTLNGPSFGFDDMPPFEMVPSDCTKVICGITCKRIDIKFNNDTVPDFSIFFTDKIKIDNPNTHNPFPQLNGVLLEYQMSFQKIPMRLVAKRVASEEVLDEEFEVPAAYVKVGREKMQEVISNLM